LQFLPVGLFLLCYAGLGALYSSFGLRHRGAGLLAFATSALLAFGPLIHWGCQQAISNTGVSTLWNLHYLSPIMAGISGWGEGVESVREVALPGGDGSAVPLWMMSVAAYVLLTAAVWVVAIIRVLMLQARWRRDIAAGGGGPPSAPANPAVPLIQAAPDAPANPVG